MKMKAFVSSLILIGTVGLLQATVACSSKESLTDQDVGSTPQTQTSFRWVKLATCKETRVGTQTLVKELELRQQIRQNGEQLTPVSLAGTYTESVINKTEQKSVIKVNRKISLTADIVTVVQANASLIDISTAGEAVDSVQKKSFNPTGVFISPSSKQVAIQLKNAAADSSELNISCDNFSNLWLYSQSHVSGADRPSN